MQPKDELRPGEDRDHDRIPDDADVAESIKDVADAFKTKDAGNPTTAARSSPHTPPPHSSERTDAPDR
jgi:hypothetical protein